MTNSNQNPARAASAGDAKPPAVSGIPIVSKAIARARVARLERAVSRLRIRASTAVGRLATECGQATAVQAKLLAAREALRGLGPEAQEPLSRRIAEAEARLEAIRPLCALPRPESPATSGAETLGSELSGGGERRAEASCPAPERSPEG